MITEVSRKPWADAHTVRRNDRDTRVTLCRYLRRGTSGQCTAEAVGGDNAEILLCAKHLARTIELLKNAGLTGVLR